MTRDYYNLWSIFMSIYTHGFVGIKEEFILPFRGYNQDTVSIYMAVSAIYVSTLD